MTDADAQAQQAGKEPKNPSEEEKAKFAQSLAALGVAQWMSMDPTKATPVPAQSPSQPGYTYQNPNEGQQYQAPEDADREVEQDEDEDRDR